MSVLVEASTRNSLLRRTWRRTWAALVAAWGALTGLAPHVLHHVGPLAGAALLAGTAGTLLFGAIGFVAATPFLVRLHRRFGTWRAPAMALAVFAAMFSLSSFVIGPAISGRDEQPPPGIEQQDHEQHHDLVAAWRTLLEPTAPVLPKYPGRVWSNRKEER